jgi:hypothetical protein
MNKENILYVKSINFKFWKKREERGKKGQRSKEDVEAVLLEYIIDLNRIFAGSEARITKQEKKLNELTDERKLVKDTLGGLIMQLVRLEED